MKSEDSKKFGDDKEEEKLPKIPKPEKSQKIQNYQVEHIDLKDIRSKIEAIAFVRMKNFLHLKEYENESAPTWCQSIAQMILQDLIEYISDFQFTVTCYIIRKTSTPPTFSNAGLINRFKDAIVQICGEFLSMNCVVIVTAISLVEGIVSFEMTE